MSEKHCTRRELEALAYGALDEAWARDHVEGCGACRGAFARFAEEREALGAAMEAERVVEGAPPLRRRGRLERLFVAAFAAGLLVAAVVAVVALPLREGVTPADTSGPKRDDREYWPLREGAEWTYRISSQGSIQEYTFRAEQRGDHFFLADGQGRQWHLERAGRGLLEWDWTPGPRGGRYKYALPLLPIPARRGTKTVEEGICIAVCAQDENVTVPAGTFRCMRIERGLWQNGTTRPLDTWWFAYGVGPVKQRRERDGREAMVMELLAWSGHPRQELPIGRSWSKPRADTSEDARFDLVTTAESWRSVWADFAKDEPAPAVDFEREMVVGVWPAGKILKVEELPGQVEVHYVEGTEPREWVLAVVPRREKRVVVVQRVVRTPRAEDPVEYAVRATLEGESACVESRQIGSGYELWLPAAIAERIGAQHEREGVPRFLRFNRKLSAPGVSFSVLRAPDRVETFDPKVLVTGTEMQGNATIGTYRAAVLDVKTSVIERGYRWIFDFEIRFERPGQPDLTHRVRIEAVGQAEPDPEDGKSQGGRSHWVRWTGPRRP